MQRTPVSPVQLSADDEVCIYGDGDVRGAKTSSLSTALPHRVCKRTCLGCLFDEQHVMQEVCAIINRVTAVCRKIPG